MFFVASNPQGWTATELACSETTITSQRQKHQVEVWSVMVTDCGLYIKQSPECLYLYMYVFTLHRIFRHAYNTGGTQQKTTSMMITILM